MSALPLHQFPNIEAGTPFSVAESTDNYLFARVVSLYDDDSIKSHGECVQPCADIMRSYGVDKIAVVNEYQAKSTDIFFPLLNSLGVFACSHGIPVVLYLCEEERERLHHTLIFAEYVRDPSLDNEHGAAYAFNM